ncbi:hypothetical protein MY1884_001526 [Beauveria asiatica]
MFWRGQVSRAASQPSAPDDGTLRLREAVRTKFRQERASMIS